MRPIPLLLLLLALPALADDPVPATAPASTPAPEAQPPAPQVAATEPVLVPTPATSPDPRFGVRLGLGIPDALTASFVYRPLPYLRLQAGPAWNYVGFGLQAGVAYTPFHWYVSPVLEASYGHFFGANLNKFVKNDTGPGKLDVAPLLHDVGYDYFSGQLGVEFGSPRGFSFSLGIGLSYLRANLHGSATSTPDPASPDPYIVSVTNPSVRAVIPSLRLGWLYYF